MKVKEEIGERPMYTPKAWKRNERRNEKAMKKKNWYKTGGYKSVIFVPCTPGSELLTKFRTRIDEFGMKIKVIEKSGKTLEGILRTADPRKKRKYERDSYPVCTLGGNANCRALNNYMTRSGYVRCEE